MIIIIGASGFIGTYLTDELVRNGYEVLAVGRNVHAKAYYTQHNIPFVTLDITRKTDFAKLPTSNVEAVILLSALLPANDQEDSIEKYIDVNVLGTVHVLEYCRKVGAKKIISTTSYADVQESWEKDRPITELESPNFKLTGDHAAYIISKNSARDIIGYYSANFNLQGIVFRLPPVYGVGPHSEIYVNGKPYKSGMQIFIDKAINGDDIEIFGDCQVSRDIVYIKDVVKAFLLALKSSKANGLYNISSGYGLSLEQQVKDIIEIFSGSRRSQIVYMPEKANNSKSYVLDITKAFKDFAYKPDYVPFKKLLQDYKKEMGLKRFSFLIDRNKK